MREAPAGALRYYAMMVLFRIIIIRDFFIYWWGLLSTLYVGSLCLMADGNGLSVIFSRPCPIVWKR